MPKLTEQDEHARQGRMLPDGTNPADFSEALARGLTVMRAFGVERPRMTLAEVSREVGLPPATVRRALITLTHLGYVRLQDRNYELTPRVLTLAESYLASNAISHLLQSTCEKICTELDASCTAAVLDGEDAVMIARAVPRQLLAVGIGIGYRVPALTSSLGRVLLAALPEPELDEYLLAKKPQTTTARTVTSKRKLRTLITQAGTDGYAYVDEEVEASFHSAAVPVRRWDGQVIAALNVGATTAALSRETILGPVLSRLRAAAEELRPQLI
ncbi:IclR family transcriptional regulator C-terminal domain-containing protein [Streptomyces sp. GbtcB6]|uniref:IclR family transcriptional regulator domain-containing protein n=1 Tax=Streptomyces sp. GbtcB6 TaxID=2824751 RepID=UPI001C2FDFEC|nr:IclR family transcriptional regulator C-terminal domain-containing protein [Streptomyces sp. GbtcB6]